MNFSKRFISSLLVVIMLMTTMITAMPVVSSAATSLLWPLPKEFTNRTCEFMELSYGEYHRGIDISSSGIDGQPIYAVADGTVHRAQWIQAEGDTSGGYGYCVILYHPSLNIYSLYAHCSSMAVSAGQTVSVGDTIAYVGSTGFSSGAHLHFELLSYYNLTNTNALIDPTPDVNYTYRYEIHTHSYTSKQTTAPTCTTAGVMTYTCSCGNSYTQSIAATGHTWSDWVKSDPTCTENGSNTRSCSKCGQTESESISATGHNYTYEITEATCTEPALKRYTCTNCYDTYTKAFADDDLYTEWDEAYPEGIDESLIEEKTQYRYSTKETTASTSSSLDGWTKYDSVTTYGAWSGNQTTTTKPTESDTLQIVGTSTVYNYYHWCSQDYDGGYENLDSIQYGSNGHYHTVTTTSPMSAYSFSDKGGQQAYRNGTSACEYNYYIWFYSGTTTTYTYQTRTKTVTNYFYKWSDFSDWQNEVVTADDNTTVETRTAYRYAIEVPEALGHDWIEWTDKEATCTEYGATLRTCTRCVETEEKDIIEALGHDWSEWDVTEVTCTSDGVNTRICMRCGETETETTPAIGHNYTVEIIDTSCTATAHERYTCQNCGDVYTVDIPLEDLYTEWNEEYPEGIDESLIGEKTQYRYSIKETTTSTASNLDGWTKYDSVTTYGAWSGNQTTTTKPTASDTLQIVGTSTVYNYYHWCSQDYDGGYENLDSIQYGSNGHYHTVTTTSPMSAYSFSDKGGKQAYRNGTTACPYNYYIWFLEGTTTTYTYQTRSKTVTNYFYKWSDFSDWQDEEVTADDNTTVETRTVYRYLTNSPEALGHDWSEWVITDATCTTDGSNSRTCNRCGETELEVIPATGHSWGEWVTTEPTCTERGSNIRTCDNCGENEVEVIPVTNHIPGEAQIITEPTCTSEGVEIVYCTVCGNTVTMAPVPMLDHNWSEWIQISAPTATEDGEQLRYCKTCKTSETEIIPATGEEEPEEPVDPNAPTVVSVNNYTITLDKITDIKEIRFAIGHYTTGSQVKAAEKNVTLDASTVKKYTDNGIFTYDLPWMGEYTFWVRYNDGSQYFVYTSVDDVTPYVESYGVKITVKDYAENYKDMWLAEGTFNSYSEIKASTGFKYQASQNKLDLYAKTTHDFSYTMTNPGAYTVLIRYNDGTTDVIHTELTVDVPEFSVNGLQTTVQNIPDIKIIRTAYGHYESVGDIKKASGVRNFSNKNDIKNAEEYMIQYREAGEVTLIVEYNNGYKHFCYINIEPKSATMIQSKNTVMFDNLDGFVMIRYAKGTYTTSSQIKAAEGSKVLKPADLTGGYAIISDLEAGTYTFCVQFDDESYDYYTVTVA